jgi:hypothetical protein
MNFMPADGTTGTTRRTVITTDRRLSPGARLEAIVEVAQRLAEIASVRHKRLFDIARLDQRSEPAITIREAGDDGVQQRGARGASPENWQAGSLMRRHEQPAA